MQLATTNMQRVHCPCCPNSLGFGAAVRPGQMPLCLEKWRPCDHRAPRQEVMVPDGRDRNIPSPQRTTPWPFASGATSSAFTARATTRTRRFLHLAVAEHHPWKKQSTVLGPHPPGTGCWNGGCARRFSAARYV